MLPTFVIIGAQKSASSFIQDCLADHPEIYLPRGETPFFESPQYEQGELGQLEDLFKGRTERVLGIKRPSYIGLPEVPARIERDLPDAKLIAVLRNPADRAISAYFHNMNYGFLPLVDVNVGLSRLLSEPATYSPYPRAPEVLEFGFYDKYLRQYQHFFDRDQILVLLHEEIVEDPLGSIRRAYEFLGVAADFVPGSLHTRPQEVIYRLPRLRFLSRRNRRMYLHNDRGTRLTRRRMNALDYAIVGAITGIDRFLLARIWPNVKPEVDPTVRRMLGDLYAQDVRRLEQLLGRELAAWLPRGEG